MNIFISNRAEHHAFFSAYLPAFFINSNQDNPSSYFSQDIRLHSCIWFFTEEDAYSWNVDHALQFVDDIFSVANCDDCFSMLLVSMHREFSLPSYKSMSSFSHFSNVMATKKVRVNTLICSLIKEWENKNIEIIKAAPLGYVFAKDVINAIQFMLEPTNRWMSNSTLVVDAGKSISNI